MLNEGIDYLTVALPNVIAIVSSSMATASEDEILAGDLGMRYAYTLSTGQSINSVAKIVSAIGDSSNNTQGIRGINSALLKFQGNLTKPGFFQVVEPTVLDCRLNGTLSDFSVGESVKVFGYPGLKFLLSTEVLNVDTRYMELADALTESSEYVKVVSNEGYSISIVGTNYLWKKRYANANYKPLLKYEFT